MRARFPLAAKILAWFFLNLALLAALAFLIAQQKMRFGLDSLVAGPAGDHLRALAGDLVREFNERPRQEWNAILKQSGDERRVQLFLFSVRGTEIAGEPIALPGEVAERLHDGGGPEDRRPPPPPNDPMRPPREPDVIGLQRAGGPARYWVLMHAPMPQLREEGPALLVLASDSLSAGGLIFDPRPLVWSAAGIVIVSVIFWWPLVRGITRSIGSMRRATARIADGNFETTLDENRNDELGALAVSINRMSERISGLISGQRRFLSDVAHELCAPLSRLQVALGILEGQAAKAEQLADVREEVDQISALVNELLAFSRASLGQRKLQLRAAELRPLLEEAARREAAAITLECAPDLTALADSDLLLRAVGNLLRNGKQYTAGEITVRASRHHGAVIEIPDNGPGIPAEILPKIFDPFVRADSSRTRETGGVGLGLTIAKTCVEACGGKIELENILPTGLRATIHLPR